MSKNIPRGSAVRWHLFSDDQFSVEVAWRRYLRWAGLILQNTQYGCGLSWVMEKEGNKQVPRYCHDSLWFRKLFFMGSLQFNRSSFFSVVSVWEKGGGLEFYLFKQVVWFTRSIISRHVQQCSVCSIEYNVYHKLHTWVYSFLPGYRAIMFCYALDFVWIFLTVILCVNFFFFFKLNYINIFYVDIWAFRFLFFFLFFF